MSGILIFIVSAHVGIMGAATENVPVCVLASVGMAYGLIRFARYARSPL